MIVLYCFITFIFFFFSPLGEEEEVLIWSSWPGLSVDTCVWVCVCVAALYQQMWAALQNGGSEAVRRSTAWMYDTSGVCGLQYTREHYSATYQWLFSLRWCTISGQKLQRRCEREVSISEAMDLNFFILCFSCIKPVCVCVCSSRLPTRYRLLVQKYSTRGFSCVFKFSREYLTTSSIRSELKPWVLARLDSGVCQYWTALYQIIQKFSLLNSRSLCLNYI